MVLPDRATEREAGENVAGLIFLGDIFLERGIGEPPRTRSRTRRYSSGVRIVAAEGGRSRIHRVVFEIAENGAVPRVAALLHDDVDHATEGAAVFGLDAGVLDFDLVDEVEGNAGARVAADQIGGFLTFHKVRIFGVCTTGKGEAVVAA